MPAATDIKIEDNDIYIDPVTGDFVSDYSDDQHKLDIFDSSPGDWKEFLLVGIAIRRELNSVGRQSFIEKKCKLQLGGDGYEDKPVTCTQNANGTFEIDSDAQRI